VARENNNVGIQRRNFMKGIYNVKIYLLMKYYNMSITAAKKFAIKFIISLYSLYEISILKNIGAALVINIRAALFC
jgi:hypothetical protein